MYLVSTVVVSSVDGATRVTSWQLRPPGGGPPVVAFETTAAHFWATHGGAELDLLITVAGQRFGFEVIGEIQQGSSPLVTPMLRSPR